MFLNEKMERIAQLNSAIFNGLGVAQIIDIQMTNTVSTNKAIDAKNVVKMYTIKLCDDKVEKLRDIAGQAVARSVFNMNYDKLEENNENLTFKVSSLSINLYDMAGGCTESCVPRSTTIKLQKEETYEGSRYILDLESYIMLSMNNEMLKQYNSVRGITKRCFNQKMEISEDTERILIVFPAAPVIPLIYSYNSTTFNLNNLIGSENPDYQFTSFGQNFTFKDEITTETDSSSIVLDNRFYKVNSVLKALDGEHLKKCPGKYVYKYKDIYGYFDIDGTDVNYYLKGKDVNYLLYSISSKYNINQFKFLDAVTENIKNNVSMTDANLKKANDIFDKICKNASFMMYLNIIPIKNMHIFKDNYNPNTYHYYIEDKSRGSEKLLTIYNTEFVLLRNFCFDAGYDNFLCNMNIFKIKSTNTVDIILGSNIKYNYGGSKDSLSYRSTVNGMYAVEGLIEENRKDEIKVNDIIKLFDYHAPDLENYHQIKQRTEEGIDKDNITKFDSLFYNIDKFDDIIIRNYLGLPVNPRFIEI